MLDHVRIWQMPPTLRILAKRGVSLLLSLLALRFAAAQDGAHIYQAHCAQCHDAAGASRIPPRSALQKMPPEEIVKALTSGVMKQQGSALSEDERAAVSRWLAASANQEQPANSANNRCPAGMGPASRSSAGWTGWGAGLDNWRYQPADRAGLSASEIPRLKLKWAFGIPNVQMMRSQPVVYQGRVYLGGDNGSVFSLDAKTGCTHWSASVKNVRTGLVIGRAGSTDALFFGDATGVVQALDLSSGKPLWETKVADHRAALVTGTPAYADGRLYVPVSSYEELLALAPGYACCSFRGSLAAIDTATGKLLWQTRTIAETPVLQGKTKDGRDIFGSSGAAVWSSPTLDRVKKIVYVTTGDNYSDPATGTSDALLAFDLESGKLLWSKQFTASDVFNMACGKPGEGSCKNGYGPDFDFGASPILVTLAAGKRCLLLGQKSGMVYAVDPDRQGEMLWQARAGKGGPLGGIQWGMATNGESLFAAVADTAMAPSPKPGQVLLDSNAGGGLVAYQVDSGKVLWKAPAPRCSEPRPCSPAQSAAISAVPGAVFSGSLDGHLRAYAANDGKVIWDFDTVSRFDAVNHVSAKGGSLDVAGPVIAGGMVFTLSGYPQFGGIPGNVLLAFGVE
jgi:polyvinyl alcohol dehydrogenase (cytochrome)